MSTSRAVFPLANSCLPLCLLPSMSRLSGEAQDQCDTETSDHASTPTSLPCSSSTERGSGARIMKQKRKALHAEIVLLLLQTLKMTAHSNSLGVYSKPIHTDLAIAWMKASLPGSFQLEQDPWLRESLREQKARSEACGFRRRAGGQLVPVGVC